MVLCMILLFIGGRPSYSGEGKVYRRIVVLSPAAADILHHLKAVELVVGKTKNIELFPKAVKVGTHVRPNVELVASLHPDLIIAASERFFSRRLADKVGASFYLYNPTTLEGILLHIQKLAKILGKEEEGWRLVKHLKAKLDQVKFPQKRPRVVYEVSQRPYLLAGKKNIVVDVVERAGGFYLLRASRKFVRLSCERVRFLRPDFYIYQVGPMNPSPVSPDKRRCLKELNFKVLKVNELGFARANTKSFDNVLLLNKLFMEWAGE